MVLFPCSSPNNSINDSGGNGNGNDNDDSQCYVVRIQEKQASVLLAGAYITNYVQISTL